MLELLSLGGSSGRCCPFHWLQGTAAARRDAADRLSILADGAAAAVLAFGLDLARSRASAAPAPETVASPIAAPQTRAGWIRRAAPVTVAALALLPLIPRPAAAVPAATVPDGWYTVFTRLRLPATASVLGGPGPVLAPVLGDALAGRRPANPAS